ncbi:MAG: hypothetical protein WAM85_17005 [Terracidiphilus sp.]
MSDIAEPLSAWDILRVTFPSLSPESGAGTTEIKPVCVIHQGKEPRWIILGNPRKALQVLRSWKPWNPGSRLRWNVMILATSAGVLPRLPGIVNLQARIDSRYWRMSLADLGENWNAVIHIGGPSHTRKAILFFLGEDHQVDFVAKAPLMHAAAGAILNETSILPRMKDTMCVPRILFQDSRRGIAVQSWLEGNPVSRRFTDAHVHLLSLLVNPHCKTRVSDRCMDIAAMLDQVDLPLDRPLLSQALELLRFDELLPEFVEHRDFAPWNLKWLGRNCLGLLDWEWSVPNGLPWQDICRFFYIQDALFHGPGKVWQEMSKNRLLQTYREQFGLSSSALRALTMHYLLRVLCTDWQNGNTRMALYVFRQIKSLLHPNQ